MASWFKKKKRTIQIGDSSKINVKPINYPAKIIIAWSKAIEGNREITQWLKENGYEELAMATFAIYLKKEARNWLQENGYPQLLALINAAEGNASAQNWLLIHDFEILYHIALAVESERESWVWLKQNATQDLFLLTLSIKSIKDKIEENHNDVHTFGKDF